MATSIRCCETPCLSSASILPPYGPGEDGKMACNEPRRSDRSERLHLCCIPPFRSLASLLPRHLGLQQLVHAYGTHSHGHAGLMGAEGLQQVITVGSMSAAYESRRGPVLASRARRGNGLIIGLRKSGSNRASVTMASLLPFPGALGARQANADRPPSHQLGQDTTTGEGKRQVVT